MGVFFAGCFNGASQYNYRQVTGRTSDFNGLENYQRYLFSVAGTFNGAISEYTEEISAEPIDWATDPSNPDNAVNKAIAARTPKYLGLVETVPTTRTAIIKKGARLGAQDANIGDWVLMGKTAGGWKVGICYRWTGGKWEPLTPEKNYGEHYHACILHICEIEELMKETGHFGALFAKALVAQQAFIDKLVAQEAFIKKLATEQAFLQKLIVQKLHIDSDDTTHQDFEAWFDETNGLKINNKGGEIFKVDTAGNVFAKNANFKDAVLEGAVVTGNSVMRGKIIPSKGLLNTWYWCIMRETSQAEWFNVFDKRINVGDRMSCWGGGFFWDFHDDAWAFTVTIFIERLDLNTFEVNGFPFISTSYPGIFKFEKNNLTVFSKGFYIGW